MFGLQFLVISLLLASWATAIPTHGRVTMPPYNWKTALCKLSPIIQRALCPRQQSTADTVSVNTPIGTARGTPDATGGSRFAVKYASAPRWQPSVLATTWELPNGSSDVTALPVPCAQTDDNGNVVGSEDCLSMILYVPSSLPSNAPTFTWIHGGSFTSGSATGPGLDGSKLADATNSIVAVIQYRLGAFGFLAPSGEHNFAVKDTINALTFLQTVLPSFGGSASKITLAGQSAGANMIRAILAAPSAKSLFQSAILHSDPMDFGFLTPSVHNNVLDTFVQSTSCSSNDLSCLNGLSTNAVLSAQDSLLNDAVNGNIDPAAGASEPIRPVLDDGLITDALDLTSTTFPQQSKPIVVSTVRNEAALTIYGNLDFDVDASLYEQLVEGTFGDPRTARILETALYAVSPAVNGASPDQRPQLEVLGTHQIWRCPNWSFARLWAGHGGKAYVGEYQLGASYPGNEAVPFCTGSGVVCHQDDIEIVFGTVQNPTSAQSALIKEIQARYSNFLRTGIPNANGFATWNLAGTNNVNAINLGAPGLAAVEACNTSYWGNFVQYDYQVFDL